MSVDGFIQRSEIQILNEKEDIRQELLRRKKSTRARKRLINSIVKRRIKNGVFERKVCRYLFSKYATEYLTQRMNEPNILRKILERMNNDFVSAHQD